MREQEEEEGTWGTGAPSYRAKASVGLGRRHRAMVRTSSAQKSAWLNALQAGPWPATG